MRERAQRNCGRAPWWCNRMPRRDRIITLDVDSIPLGSDFIKVLREEVGKCDTLLAIIGRHWLDARDADGKRRLDNENDFVRVEMATAG
jgi:hypothetical protein